VLAVGHFERCLGRQQSADNRGGCTASRKLQEGPVTQVDHPRLRQRLRHRHLAIANQVGRPQVAGPPRHGAVQQHLALSRGQRRRERVEFLRAVGILRRFIEADLRHLFRHTQVHHGRDALRLEVAQRLLCGLAGDEQVVADARECGLEESRDLATATRERDSIDMFIRPRRRLQRYHPGIFASSSPTTSNAAERVAPAFTGPRLDRSLTPS